MSNINSDYEVLKLVYGSLYESKFKSKLIIKIYLLTIKQLEEKSSMLDISDKIKFDFDNYITYSIGNILYKKLYNSIKSNDKKQEKEVIDLFKKEIRRINEFKNSFDINAKYCCRLTKDIVMEIMLDYVKEEELDKKIINIYPKNLRELLLLNQYKEDSIKKLKKVSI